MKTPTLTQIPVFELPADLRERVGPRMLASLAIEAVHRVKPGSSTFQNKGELFSEPMLLTILSYCYASGLYASSEVERAIQDDETVRYLCARVFPDADDFRQFRRRAATEIKQCLKQLFAMADQTLNPPAGGYLTYAELSLGQMVAVGRDWEFAAEAGRRVTRAIQADSIALDA